MLRTILGILIWAVILIGSGIGLNSYLQNSSEAVLLLTSFVTKSRKTVELEIDGLVVLKVGDPIVVYDNDIARVVGKISQIDSTESTQIGAAFTDKAFAEFYSCAPLIHDGDYLSYHHTPDSMEWMLQMMLPPETRKKIGQLLVDAYRKHQTEIVTALQPIVERSVRDASEVIREEFRASVDSRYEQIQLLGDRYQMELVENELVPLVQDEIWPIIHKEAQPLATKIGEEIFEQASVWRFGWRYIYDRSPLPERNLVQKEFEKFLDSKAIPILETHLPDIVHMQQTILKRVSENEKVRNSVTDMVTQVARDPEFQTLVTDILRDVFIDNERLQKVLEENWNSPEGRKALDITNQKLEPTITDIGRTLFGSPRERITPEFSRVLRNRVLNKDDRWLQLRIEHRGTVNTGMPKVMKMKRGVTGTENPFHRPTRESN